MKRLIAAGILFVFSGKIACMKEQFLLMKKGLDDDIEFEKDEEEKKKKKKRKKTLFKFARLAYKAWRM